MKKIFPKIDKQGEVLEWEMSWVEILRKINKLGAGTYVFYLFILFILYLTLVYQKIVIYKVLSN